MGGCPRAVVASLGITLGVLTGCGGGRSTAPPTPSAIERRRDHGRARSTSPRAACWPSSTGRRSRRAGYQVRRAIGIGPREFVGPALALGLVELVPEYAGTALDFLSLGSRRRHGGRRRHPRRRSSSARRRPAPHRAGRRRRRRTPTPSSSRRDTAERSTCTPQRPRRRRARPHLRRSTGVPDPPAVPRRPASSVYGLHFGHVLRPRRRRAHHTPGAGAGRHRRRPAVHHRSGHRHRRPRRARRTTGACSRPRTSPRWSAPRWSTGGVDDVTATLDAVSARLTTDVAAPAERRGRQPASPGRRSPRAWLERRAWHDAPASAPTEAADRPEPTAPMRAGRPDRPPAGAVAVGARPARHRRCRAASARPARAGSSPSPRCSVWVVVAAVSPAARRVTDRLDAALPPRSSPACAPTG